LRIISQFHHVDDAIRAGSLPPNAKLTKILFQYGNARGFGAMAM